jgi:hypothetical protein
MFREEAKRTPDSKWLGIDLMADRFIAQNFIRMNLQA